MHSYFKKMGTMGKQLSDKARARSEDNAKTVIEYEKQVEAAVKKVIDAGLPAEQIHKRGELTAMERIEKTVDPGTFLPLNSLYDPHDNEEGSVGIVSGLATIAGRHCVLIASDNKVLAGAWIPGQGEKIFRAQDMAQIMNVPLVWLLNCSGVKLTQQEEVYAGRRSGGHTFFRHAAMETGGVPVLAAVYGTNPAGGGYHGISPSKMFAHKNANIAVGGAGIVSGMSPKGFFDQEGAEAIIAATRAFKAVPPGSVRIHHDETGFFSTVHETEEQVIEQLRKAMAGMPATDPSFYRVDEPKAPLFAGADLPWLVPHNQKLTYKVEEFLSRIFDGSEHLEFRPDYGPEIYAGLAKFDGFLVGIIGNRQGALGKNYPEYTDKYSGIGGKLYRQGLIKMNEMVTLCGRDKIPLLWVQDTSGIDVGDIAEKAELLGLGQSLIYSIEDSKIPMLCIVLRKGTAAAHYVMGGPQASRNNAFTLGMATTEINVMHGETASVASFARRLVKEQDSGKSLDPVIDKMNALAKQYHDQSRPIYCAKRGFIDEVVAFSKVRDYVVAFARSCYQNPRAHCPHHVMMLPRILRG
jgi:glutaconyl-CoA decarboxylase subunit alpha